jgi:hypothetical protein
MINITQNYTVGEAANASDEHGGFLSVKTLIAILILVIYTIATPIFHKINFHYIHESGICMILGCLVGVIAMLVNPSVTISLINRKISLTL